MTNQYGIPYKGSKNSIAREIVAFLPPADVLIDICAGGCAITHAALEACNGFAPKWRHIIANDIDPMPLRLFDAARSGKLENETRWITREDFAQLKDTDPYVRYCWSFGNNGETYMYAKEIEPWKRALHMARVWKDRSGLSEFGIQSDGSWADIIAHAEEYRGKYIRWWLSKQSYTAQEIDELIAQTSEDVAREEKELRAYLRAALEDSGMTQAEVQRRLGTQMAGHYFGTSQWEFPTQEMYERMQEFMPALTEDYNAIVGLHRLRKRLQSLQSLENLRRLERVQSLQSFQSLENLTVCVQSYEDVHIPDNAVIYADIPYEGTDCGCYDGFDHAAFLGWAATRSAPVYVSSYKIRDERFGVVWRRCKRQLAKGCGKLMEERIYANRAGVRALA